MVYNYLLDLYGEIEKRHTAIETDRAAAKPGSEQEEFCRGQRAAIDGFQEFLKEKYHRKLPRRLQK